MKTEDKDKRKDNDKDQNIFIKYIGEIVVCAIMIILYLIFNFSNCEMLGNLTNNLGIGIVASIITALLIKRNDDNRQKVRKSYLRKRILFSLQCSVALYFDMVRLKGVQAHIGLKDEKKPFNAWACLLNNINDKTILCELISHIENIQKHVDRVVADEFYFLQNAILSDDDINILLKFQGELFNCISTIQPSNNNVDLIQENLDRFNKDLALSLENLQYKDMLEYEYGQENRMQNYVLEKRLKWKEPTPN